MQIDYSISLWNYTHYANAPSLERILALVREQGYGIELWGAWRDENDLYSDVGCKRLKSTLQGMRVSLHTAVVNTFELHKKQIDAAAELRAPVIVLHPNDLYASGTRELDEALAHQIVAYARARGVKLALENGQLPFIARALERIEGLYACLDVGHVYLTTEPMRKFLDAMKSRLIHLHIQDLETEPLVGVRLPGTGVDHYTPGAGGIPATDWKLLVATLEEINFQGTAVFEIQPYNPLQTALQSRAFLRQVGLR
ncbi:MAG: sugar phosphate isomerase/epimerase [Chloroflexi bacterium]|nr:sugar phosphate isomerase/epimerase [Chloroflexota bacterium]